MATRNLTAVEGLRFLLFLGIFVFHCVSGWLPIGWGGVEAFLVIGAYFLTRKQLKQEQTIKVGESFLHRIKRLYPAYMAVILLFVGAQLVYTGKFNSVFFWFLFSAQNFRCLFPDASYSLGCFFGHFWYIGLDVWLFLIWIIILRLTPKKNLRIAFIISLCVGLLWRTLFIIFRPDNASIAYMIPIGQLDCWALGGLVAINVHDKGHSNKIMWAELLVGAVGIIAITIYNASLHQCDISEAYQLYHSAAGYLRNPITGNILFFIALLSAGVLRYCINSTKKHPILSVAPLVALGGMTYELYCFHYPIRFVADYFIENDFLMVIVALIATIVASMLWNKWAMPIIKRVIH
jgi:peptidoglycan/LPS O-acetylase OafA/YrhL